MPVRSLFKPRDEDGAKFALEREPLQEQEERGRGPEWEVGPGTPVSPAAREPIAAQRGQPELLQQEEQQRPSQRGAPPTDLDQLGSQQEEQGQRHRWQQEARWDQRPRSGWGRGRPAGSASRTSAAAASSAPGAVVAAAAAVPGSAGGRGYPRPRRCCLPRPGRHRGQFASGILEAHSAGPVAGQQGPGSELALESELEELESGPEGEAPACSPRELGSARELGFEQEEHWWGQEERWSGQEPASEPAVAAVPALQEAPEFAQGVLVWAAA